MTLKVYKWLALIVLVLFCATCEPVFAYAHLGPGHNADLEKALFNSTTFKKANKDNDQGEAVQALEDAAFLCIDQIDNQGTDHLRRLRSFGFPFLLRFGGLKSINPESKEYGHQSYTHYGWDQGFYERAFINNQEGREKWEKCWNKRKTILIDTTRKVLNASNLPFRDPSVDKQCESFSALIYYIHILGDYVEHDDSNNFNGSKTRGYKISFARKSQREIDIFSELEKHLEILFDNPKNDPEYNQLIRELKTIADDSREIILSNDGVYDDEAAKSAHENAERLMALLTGDDSRLEKDYGYDESLIYKLLKKNDLFKKAFPSA